MPTDKKMSIRLSSDQLVSLNLNEGSNEITYSVTSNLQGEQVLNAKIFLWNYYDRIVISDIDGTITKSDVLGQIMPMMGGDWSHPGVVNLYNNIV